MTSGPNVAFVQFPANANKDFVQLDAPGLGCVVKEPCEVRFDVVGVRAEGTYQGAIDAYAVGRKLASANVSTVRPEAVFQPLVSGDVVKNGRIEFDATASDSFVLGVQNPPGSAWGTFILRDCSDEKATVCTDPTRALAQATAQPKGSGAAPNSSPGNSVNACRQIGAVTCALFCRQPAGFVRADRDNRPRSNRLRKLGGSGRG